MRRLLSGVRRERRNARGRHDSRAAIQYSRLRCEMLESRELLSVGPQQLQLFNPSPALFVENQGQWADSSVRYMHQGDRMNVALTDAGPVFQAFRPHSTTGESTSSDFDALPNHPNQRAAAAEATQTLEFSARFLGANAVSPVGDNRAETLFNYFVGPQDSWRSGVPSYQTVAYEGLYEGIDLYTFGERSLLKYEFHVSPGADYKAIQIHYEGIQGLALNEDGSLVVSLGDQWGTLVDSAPYIYQEISGQRIEVLGQFVLLDSNTYSFVLTGPYDSTQTLVIDPNLAWSTYLGGSDEDTGIAVSVSDTGHVYVTGHTLSSGWISGGFDTSYNGNRDAFVVKLNPSGSLAWSTYLGGSGEDYGVDVAVDGAGSVYVTGWTYSSGWISGGYDTTYGGKGDAYAVKLTRTGSYVWGTYLGGGSGEAGYGILTDNMGAVYVTGSTTSPGWTSGGYDTTFGGYWADGFLVKLSTDGAHLWSTYLGGSDLDVGRDVALDGTGGVYVTGYTKSAGWTNGGFDTSQNGGYDAFLVKLTTNGGHTWSTYLGGSSDDYGYGIASDAASALYVTGYTNSSGWTSGGYDTTYNGGQDAFVAKLTASGGFAWSTYMGGSSDENGYGIAVDNTGVYVSGETYSSGWTSGGFDTSYNGGGDAFVAKLTATGGHSWSSYLGGNSGDGGFGIAADGTGGVYLTGYTASSSWTSGGYDTSYNGNQDAFLAKINDHAPPTVSPTSSTFDSGLDGWTLQGSGVLSHSSTGGNPGGYAKFTDIAGPVGDGWLIAPAKFLGNWSGFNEIGLLTWDHRIITYGDIDTVLKASVIISGPGGQATFTGSSFQSAWTRFSAPISIANWTINSGSWNAILSNVTSLKIRIEAVWNNGALDVDGVDNIQLAFPDTNPPTPNPSTWATMPYATGPYSIKMVATTATDPEGNGVEYYFRCLTAGGHDSGWQTSPAYEDTGLSPNTTYSYQVKTRDRSSNRNEGSYSVSRSATTQQAPDTNPPTPNPSTWATDPYATGPYSIRMVATTATDPEGNGVEYYFRCLTAGGHDSGWQTSPIYEDTGLSPATIYTYQVRTRDTSANWNEGAYSVASSAATQQARDVTPPTSSVTVAAYQRSTSFIVTWTGTDEVGGSGIAHYDISVSDNFGPYRLWRSHTTATSAKFTGKAGHHYSFVSVATDRAGNVQTTLAPAATTLIDVTRPTSRVAALPASQNSQSFVVNWYGSDGVQGSGIAGYSVYVSDNGGSFQPWLINVAQTSAVFTGQNGHRYGFYSVATDAAGNVQKRPSAAQATTLVDIAPPTSKVAALATIQTSTKFSVKWSGTDGKTGSGIAAYTIYVSDNGGDFVPWLIGTTRTSATFSGLDGHTYAFYSVATDKAGNVQPTPTAPQAVTTVAVRRASSRAVANDEALTELLAEGAPPQLLAVQIPAINSVADRTPKRHVT